MGGVVRIPCQELKNSCRNIKEFRTIMCGFLHEPGT